MIDLQLPRGGDYQRNTQHVRRKRITCT